MQRCCAWRPCRFTGRRKGLSLSPSTKLTLVSVVLSHLAALRGLIGEYIGARTMELRWVQLPSEQRPRERTITAVNAATIRIPRVIESDAADLMAGALPRTVGDALQGASASAFNRSRCRIVERCSRHNCGKGLSY